MSRDDQSRGREDRVEKSTVSTQGAEENQPRVQSVLQAVEDLLEGCVFRVRWLLVIGYLALIGCLFLLALQSIREFLGLVDHVLIRNPGAHGDDTWVIVDVLAMIDLVLVMNLVLMVLFVGYVNFVSKIEREDHADWPGWMGGLNYGGLKAHLLGSVIAIASIKMLKAFLSYVDPSDRVAKVASGDMVLGLSIFGALLFGAAIMALVNRIKAGVEHTTAATTLLDCKVKAKEHALTVAHILPEKPKPPEKRWKWFSTEGEDSRPAGASSTPQWRLRRLASRAARILKRRAGESAAAAKDAATFERQRQKYVAAYDDAVKYVATRNKELTEARQAGEALLKGMQIWVPLLARDVPGFEGGAYGDHPQVLEDVLEDGERLLTVIDEARTAKGEPLTYREQALAQLGPLVQTAAKELAEAEAANRKYQRLMARLREQAVPIERQLVVLRRALLAKLGRDDSDYQKLRVERAGYPDDDDEPGSSSAVQPPPAASTAPAA